MSKIFPTEQIQDEELKVLLSKTFDGELGHIPSFYPVVQLPEFNINNNNNNNNDIDMKEDQKQSSNKQKNKNPNQANRNNKNKGQQQQGNKNKGKNQPNKKKCIQSTKKTRTKK